jgi:hypothetical protein
LELIVTRLRQDGDIEDGISLNFLARNWPPAFKEWGTRAVRDAFFAISTISSGAESREIEGYDFRGMENGLLSYVGRKPDGTCAPFHWKSTLSPFDVELSDDMYIIQRETAESYRPAPPLRHQAISPHFLPSQHSGLRREHLSRDSRLVLLNHIQHRLRDSAGSLERRGATAKMDEFLHESALKIRYAE